jgi:hypothetical protein
VEAVVWLRALVIALLVGCAFDHGKSPGDASTVVDGSGGGSDAGSGSDGGGTTDGTPAGIAYVGHTIGKSTTATVTVTTSMMPGATYVLAVASKPYETVANVAGLGATWTKIADQCGARSQTGAALFIGRGATSPGTVTVTLSADPANTIAIVAIYTGSSTTGTFAMYNALDASTCSESNTSVDVNMYTFSIAAMNRVVTAVATRQYTHTPGTGLVQRVQDTQGSSGDTAGLAIVDGLVTTVAGSFTSDVDVAAVAVELRP